jgi:hypothetical protein
MSIINVDQVLPFSGTIVDVNGVDISTPLTTFGNTVVGKNAGTSIIAGGAYQSINNTALGKNAMESLTIGSSVTAIGYDAYADGNGVNDTAIGQGALKAITSGSYGNTAVGSQAFFQLTAATTGNSGLGLGAGEQLSSGNHNTFIGFTSGAQFSGGDLNTTLGSRSTGIGTPVSGNSNLFLGANACLNYSGGDNNVYVGAYDLITANFTAQSGSNNILIGKNALKATASTSNSITLGNANHNILRCAVTSITSLSDARDKKEIEELPVGLEFVKGLKPVKFVWDDRSEEGKHDIADFGFIAQDLKSAQEEVEMSETLKLVYEENPEKLEASYGKLIPILVKAIQDLNAKVELLENK